ncbi:hypothetical protein D3C72_1400260 [compost metagenome]
MLRRQRCREMAFVITAQRLAQFWNATLPGVEGFAIVQPIDGGLIDEVRARQITFADPERQEIVSPPGIIHDFNNAALGSRQRARTQTVQNGH